VSLENILRVIHSVHVGTDIGPRCCIFLEGCSFLLFRDPKYVSRYWILQAIQRVKEACPQKLEVIREILPISVISGILSQGYLKRVPRDRKTGAVPYELSIDVGLHCFSKGWVLSETECVPGRLDVTE
jgi:hypothetical protein